MSHCLIKVTSPQIITTDTETTVTFDNEITDPASEFNTTTYTYTASTAADRLIICHIVWILAEDGFWSENQYDKIIIKKNDTEVSSYLHWHTTIFEDTQARMVDIIDLAIDDTITISVKQNSTTQKSVGAASSLAIKTLS